MAKAKKPPTHAANQRSFTKRRQDEGWKRIAVWVPPGYVEAFEKARDRLKKKWTKELASE
jgi:hypothetical protein